MAAKTDTKTDTNCGVDYTAKTKPSHAPKTDGIKRAYALCRAVFQSCLKNPNDPQVYFDFLQAVAGFRELRRNEPRIKRADISTESHYADMSAEMRDIHKMNRELQPYMRQAMKNGADVDELYNVYSRSLLLEAPYSFEQYLMYVELDRPPAEKFYMPRRKTMKPIVDLLQKIEDRELDELLISLPPRVGKTTVVLFFFTWQIGKHPDLACLYSAFSNTITKSFYKGILEIIKDPVTYHWQEVFPASPLSETNAQDQTINAGRKTRYATATMRSIDGTLNGSCDCDNILCADDLCSGIEEAVNTDRMNSLWSKVMNDLLSRGKLNCRIIWIGTRWSQIDPIGNRIELLQNDPTFAGRKWAVINVPALDKNDESNFVYAYNKGFTTEHFHRIRASFERVGDMASWLAQFQGVPIEREGTVFDPSELRFYNGTLPDGEPDRIFMAVDPAFGGGDYTAAPICEMYDDDVYVVDVVYTDEDKRTSIPAIVNAIKRYGVTYMQLEANKMLQSYADELSRAIQEAGCRCTVTTKAASTAKSKEQRIFDRAPDIREYMVFREDGTRSKAYSMFMQNVYSFKALGKNKHDDAPDSLAMAIATVRRFDRHTAVVFKRFM